MKRIKLDRLFKAAAQHHAPGHDEEMPAHMKTRLLAHWRSGVVEEDWFLPLLLRRALLCAGLIMLLCVAWSSNELWSDADDDVALVNFELRQDVLP